MSVPADNPPGDPEVADEVLLERLVTDGDHDAFRVLVHRHTDRVYAVCLRYFRNPADAQDAVQETFLAVHRGARSFAGGARFTTWLYRVATNVCHDIERKRVRRPQSAGVDPSWLGDHAPDDIDRAELRLDLRKALKALGPEHREAVLLHAFYGYTHAEIAERTGAPVGTIKSRVHRGLAQMAAVLPPEQSMQPSRGGVLPRRRPPRDP